MTILLGTLREAASRRILLVGLLVSLAFIGLFWTGFAFALDRGRAQVDDPTVLTGASTVMTVLGLYAVQFLAAVGATLLAAGSVASEVESGRVLAVLARPVSRTSWLGQRTVAFTVLAATYMVVMAGGVLLVARLVGGYGPLSTPRGLGLLVLECVVLVAVGTLASTRLSAVPAGVVVVALYGLAWIAGIMEFVGDAIGNAAVTRVGVVVSLAMPTDALWRGASYYLQSPAFLAAMGVGEGIPFAGVRPPGAALLAWTAGYVVVALLLSVRALRRRDL